MNALITEMRADPAEGPRGRGPEEVSTRISTTPVGPFSRAALFAMREQGRIACCGAVSMYDGAPRPGPVGVPGLIVVKRLTLKGFIVSDYAHLDADAEHELALWAKQGRVAYGRGHPRRA